MIRKTYFSIFLFIFFIFVSGCSDKNYYKPQKVSATIEHSGEMSSKIFEVGYSGATLMDGSVITKSGFGEFKIPAGFIFLAKESNLVIATGDCKKNILYDLESGSTRYVDIPRRIVSAAFIPKSNKIVFLTENNSYGLYDYKEERVVVKYDSDKAITADIKMASPIMLENLVIVPTLDGKIVILDKNSGMRVREIVVAKADEFNNITHLFLKGDRLVAATAHRVISVSPQLIDALDMEIRELFFVKDYIFILAKDGTIYKCDKELKILESKKFPFAHFVGAVYDNSIYLIEKEGYVISIDLDLKRYKVLRLPQKIEKWFFVANGRIYYDRYYFQLY